tara:strand:- start:12886 stop:13644 length:759 start_codon:yes stop_codon:yes gene_type:complete
MNGTVALRGKKKMWMLRQVSNDLGTGGVRIISGVACLLQCVFALQAHAGEWDEAAWDWRAGDLIFRSGIDPMDDLIAQASEAEFGSVAIVRAGSGGPHVVYVDPLRGVTETMLDDFIADLGEENYAAYRVKDMADWGQGDSPISYNALLVAYGHDADRFRLLGGDAYYGAEMVFLAALGAGVALGASTKRAELAKNSPDLKEAFLADWQENPYCTYVTTRKECWSAIRGTAVLTSGAIQSDPGLEKVYPLPD